MNLREEKTRREVSILAMKLLGAVVFANETGSAISKTVMAAQRDKLANYAAQLSQAAQNPDVDENVRQAHETVNRHLETLNAELEATGGSRSVGKNVKNAVIAGAITVFGFVAPGLTPRQSEESPTEGIAEQTIDTYPANKRYGAARPLRTSL